MLFGGVAHLELQAAVLADELAARHGGQVAQLLGVKGPTLSRAIYDGRVAEPTRGPSGAFLWDREAIRRACWVMLHQDLDDVLAEAGKERAQ